MAMSAYELEALPSLEGEFEEEFEWEVDPESDQFFGWLRNQWQAVQTPGTWQRRAAIGAGKGAMTAGAGLLGTAIGGPVGAAIGAPLGAGIAGAIYPERLAEVDGEFEFEAEINPLQRVPPEALMEHLGHAAKDATTEAEAEAFLGALVPLAARLIPRAAPVLMRAAPQLIRGVAGAAQSLLRHPATRPLVRTLPTIVRQTASNIANQVAQGRPVTAQQAVQTLARNTTRLLASPQRCVHTYQRSKAMDRRFHGAPQAALSRPV